MSQADLRAGDLPLPVGLEMAIAQRQEAMRAAAEARALEALEAAAYEEQSPLERFLEPFIPKFLRGDREEDEEARYREEERRRDDRLYEEDRRRRERDAQDPFN